MNDNLSFPGLLAVLFIGLKLTHYIDWSWWLVLLPIYFPLALIFSCLAIWIVIAGTAGIFIGIVELLARLKNE